MRNLLSSNNNTKSKNQKGGITSEIFSTLITKIKEDKSESRHIIEKYKPFFEILKSNPDFSKNLSKVLSDWYKKNHNKLVLGGCSGFSLDSPKTNREEFEKIQKGDSELGTQDFWDNHFFPIYKNILEDSGASFEVNKDVKFYMAARALDNFLYEDINAKRGELKNKSIINKVLSKNKVSDYEKIYKGYIPDFEVIERTYIRNSFKEERLKSPDYIEAKNNLFREIGNAFKDTLEKNENVVNNIELAEKVFKFFYDQRILDSKEGRHIVYGDAIISDFLDLGGCIISKTLEGSGFSGIERERASLGYYNPSNYEPYSGCLLTNMPKLTMKINFGKDKIIRFPIRDLYLKNNGHTSTKKE